MSTLLTTLYEVYGEGGGALLSRETDIRFYKFHFIIGKGVKCLQYLTAEGDL